LFRLVGHFYSAVYSLLKPVQSRRIFSSLDARLHLLKCCVKHCRVFRSGKALTASLLNRSRCPEDSVDKLSGQKSYTGIGLNMKRFLFDGCRDIGEHICRIVFEAESLTVVRRLFVRHTLAGPFNKSVKVSQPKFICDFKSNPIIFSRNILYLTNLQQFTHKLMGQ